MSGMPLETCSAFNERWNNKFYYKVAYCWLFLRNKAPFLRTIYTLGEMYSSMNFVKPGGIHDYHRPLEVSPRYPKKLYRNETNCYDTNYKFLTIWQTVKWECPLSRLYFRKLCVCQSTNVIPKFIFGCRLEWRRRNTGSYSEWPPRPLRRIAMYYYWFSV
jgi:hypothetical protein